MVEKLLEKRREGGFTLIELLIVIIILAILAAIVVFAVGTTTTNAQVASCDANVKSVETALEAYKAENGNYPTSITYLVGGTSGWLRSLPPSVYTNTPTSGNNYAITDATAGSGQLYVYVNDTTGADQGPFTADGTPDPCSLIS